MKKMIITIIILAIIFAITYITGNTTISNVISETYITKMLNGKVISTKLLSRDTYDAMERIIIKGTKSANNKTINVTEGTTESVESSTNTTEEKRPETTPSGNKTTTETNTTPTTESKE